MGRLRTDWYSHKRPEIPDFIKIDVEGGEVEVLKGAREIIEKNHPMLMVEDHRNNIEEIRRLVGPRYECAPVKDWGNHQHIFLKWRAPT